MKRLYCLNTQSVIVRDAVKVFLIGLYILHIPYFLFKGDSLIDEWRSGIGWIQ